MCKAKVAASFAALILITAPSAVADEVSLSRYVVQHDMFDPGWELTSFDTALLRRFCGDEDGCLVIVRSRRVGQARSAYVFLSIPDPPGSAAMPWTTTNHDSYLVDNNMVEGRGVTADSSGLTCSFSDLDVRQSGVGLDNAVGFSLMSYLDSLSAPGPCSLSISD